MFPSNGVFPSSTPIQWCEMLRMERMESKRWKWGLEVKNRHFHIDSVQTRTHISLPCSQPCANLEVEPPHSNQSVKTWPLARAITNLRKGGNRWVWGSGRMMTGRENWKKFQEISNPVRLWAPYEDNRRLNSILRRLTVSVGQSFYILNHTSLKMYNIIYNKAFIFYIYINITWFLGSGISRNQFNLHFSVYVSMPWSLLAYFQYFIRGGFWDYIVVCLSVCVCPSVCVSYP